MPLFSVIIPTYNRRELLKEALESLRLQTFHDYEIIVVDDGSNDGTWEYLASLGSRVRPIYQDNSGPGAARNKGMQHANGKYITFLDSDDLWFPWTLEVFRQAFEVAPLVNLVSGTHSSREVFHEFSSTPKFAYRTCLFDSSIEGMLPIGGTPSVAMNKIIAQQVGGFCQKRTNAEDIDFWMSLGLVPGFIQILFPPLYWNRAHCAKISHDSKLNESGLTMMLEKERRGKYPGGKQYRNVRLNVITAMFRSASIDFLSTGKASSAWRLYVKSFEYQVRQHRFRYLFGFPFLWIRASVLNFVK